MATIKTKVQTVLSIPSPTVNGYKLTALASATVNGTTLYVIKSCGKTADNIQYPVCMYKVTNFLTKPVVKLLTLKDVTARHANSLTGIGSSFFIATMNEADMPQVLMVNTSGKLKKKIWYRKNGVLSKLNCLNYIGTNKAGEKRFIAGVGRTNEGRYIYDIATLKGQYLECENATILGTINPDWTSNDLFYKNGKLYHTFFKQDSDGNILTNRIYCYKINTSKSGQYEPIDIIVSSKPKQFDKKYEIEEFFIYDSNWYSACNCGSSKSAYNKDFIVRLTK